MRELVDDIASGRFADEWDAERDAGYPKFEALRAKAMAPEILAFEADLRTKLGEGATATRSRHSAWRRPPTDRSIRRRD